MDYITKDKALDYLHLLINQPLIYAFKLPDTELYDFGFGERIDVVNRQGKRKSVGAFALHAICRFKIIWRNGAHRIDEYYEDTESDVFAANIQSILSLKARRIALSEKNDLWVDLGDCWVVFATHKDNEESWRFFQPYTNNPHLLASNSWLRVD